MKTTKITGITRIISTGKEISIGDLDGKTTISQSKDVFKSWIDPNLKKFGLNRPSRPTKKTNVAVSEVIDNGKFLRIFKSINPDLDKNVLTMSQIIEFCRSHPSWLRQDGFGTFFLTKKAGILQRAFSFVLSPFFEKKSFGRYFVVGVCMYLECINVYVLLFENDCDWHGKSRHRVVFPHDA